MAYVISMYLKESADESLLTTLGRVNLSDLDFDHTLYFDIGMLWQQFSSTLAILCKGLTYPRRVFEDDARLTTFWYVGVRALRQWIGERNYSGLTHLIMIQTSDGLQLDNANNKDCFDMITALDEVDSSLL